MTRKKNKRIDLNKECRRHGPGYYATQYRIVEDITATPYQIRNYRMRGSV